LSEQVDTGFEDVIAGVIYTPDDASPISPVVTATVTTPTALSEERTQIPDAGLTEEGKQALKSLIRMPEMKPAELAKLAREFAMDIKERHVILAEYKLTDAQYDFLEQHNDFYKQALRAAAIEWHSPLSTAERIKVEAAAILEDSLVGLGARMQSKTEGLPGVIEAAKLFAKVAGVGERELGAGTPGERFTINIDLGGDQKITVASSPAPSVVVAGVSAGAIPALREKEAGA